MVLARKIPRPLAKNSLPTFEYKKMKGEWKMIDMSHEKIEQLFYEKIRRATMQSFEQTFDFQFSDDWFISDDCLG